MVQKLNRMLLFITHLVTGILIQDILLAIICWYYDTRVYEFIIGAAMCLVFLGIDYVIDGRLLRKANLKFDAKWHIYDLIIAIPSVWFAFEAIIQTNNHSIIDKAIISGIIVLIINTLIVIERIILIRKINAHTGGKDT